MPSEASIPSSAARTLSGLEHDFAAFQVFAGEASIGSRFGDGARGDADAVALRVRALLHDHGIGARGNHAAGEDPHTLSRAYGRGRRPACERLTHAHEDCLAVVYEVREADGVAIHRRAVVPGDVVRRDDVGGENAIERLPDVDALGDGHRREERANQLARTIDRHRIRIVVVGGKRLQEGFRLGRHSEPPGVDLHRGRFRNCNPARASGSAPRRAHPPC
jgi:hypothetical protein